jgi:hypothetical protein
MPTRKCNVCEVERPTGDFPANRNQVQKQCRLCGWLRMQFWLEGIIGIPSPMIREIVRAQDA